MVWHSAIFAWNFLSVSSEKDEEQIAQQINFMSQRIDKEKARGAKLERNIQLHVSLSTEDQVRKYSRI